MKTYAAKSSAVRAAKQAGFQHGQFEIVEADGKFGWVSTKDQQFAKDHGGEFTPDGYKDVTQETSDEAEVIDRIVGENLGLNTVRCPSCHREDNLATENFTDVAGLPQTKIVCHHCGWFHSEIAQHAEKPFKEISEKEHAEHRGEKRAQSSTAKPCSVVWDIAESMPGARRKDVLTACQEAGVAFYTARTQYQLWLTASRASKK